MGIEEPFHDHFIFVLHCRTSRVNKPPVRFDTTCIVGKNGQLLDLELRYGFGSECPLYTRVAADRTETAAGRIDKHVVRCLNEIRRKLAGLNDTDPDRIDAAPPNALAQTFQPVRISVERKNDAAILH